MSIAPTLRRYLAANNIQYDVIAHEPTLSSTRTAEACGISGNSLAKAVVLRHDGGYVLAVLPASRHIHLTDLCDQLGEQIEMADEPELDKLFPDCAHGAVPAVGQCYGLSLLVDDSIDTAPQVYVEAGDHRTLICLSHSQFADLTAQAMHGHFSAQMPTGNASAKWS
jgi:Ala-tRNA(Pro) deacylase